MSLHRHLSPPLIIFCASLIVGGAALSPARTIHVDAGSTADGCADGTSWEKAYPTLPPALVEAADGDEIRVAKGIYYPGASRTDSFLVQAGVTLAGGFDPATGVRDHVSFVTILSGDIGMPNRLEDNCYHVVTVSSSETDPTIIVDGLTITGGNANGAPASELNGGGIWNSGNLILNECIVRGNHAGDGVPHLDGGSGGGIWNSGKLGIGSSKVQDNAAGAGGKGIPSEGEAAPEETEEGGGQGGGGGGIWNSGILEINRSTFSGNSTGIGGSGASGAGYGGGGGRGGSGGDGGDGGAIGNDGELTIRHSHIVSNATGMGAGGGSLRFGPGRHSGGRGGDGGGVFNGNSGTLTIIDSTVVENSSNVGPHGGFEGGAGEAGSGGGIASDGPLTIVNSTVDGNMGAGGGGGVYCSTTLVIDQSTISGNTTGSTQWFGSSGGGVYCSGPLTITRSTLSGNSTSGGLSGGVGGGLYCSSTATISHSTIAGNSTGHSSSEHAQQFRPGSFGGGICCGDLVMNHCTVSGNTTGSDQFNGLFADGGGIYLLNDSSAVLSHSIIGGNSALGSAFDIKAAHPVELVGKCLVSDTDGWTLLTGSENLVVAAPQLGALALNGGPTKTMLPLTGSPAIDAGPASHMGGRDQRGLSRFVNGRMDIGAVEIQPTTEQLLAEFDEDLDGDGYSNGLEMAIGSNPWLPDPAHPNRLRVSLSDGVVVLKFGQANESLHLKLTRSTASLRDFSDVIALSHVDFSPGLAIRIEDPTPPPFGGEAYYRLEAWRTHTP